MEITGKIFSPIDISKTKVLNWQYEKAWEYDV